MSKMPREEFHVARVCRQRDGQRAPDDKRRYCWCRDVTAGRCATPAGQVWSGTTSFPPAKTTSRHHGQPLSAAFTKKKKLHM